MTTDEKAPQIKWYDAPIETIEVGNVVEYHNGWRSALYLVRSRETTFLHNHFYLILSNKVGSTVSVYAHRNPTLRVLGKVESKTTVKKQWTKKKKT